MSLLARRTTREHAAGEPIPAATSGTAHRSLLRPLGVVGYDAIEPVLLAALATEEPLLLVSDHGAAKTMLLVRLAEALGVELRHYNASLLQFDDLVGYPIPDELTGGVRYAAPPGAIWGAAAVFLDEIGRCRPETANNVSEDNVRMQIVRPWVVIGTDAGGYDPDRTKRMVHPRAYGTYPRILGRYVREEKLMTLEEAVRKMTGGAAARLGLRDRGLLREGMFADVVVSTTRRSSTCRRRRSRTSSAGESSPSS